MSKVHFLGAGVQKCGTSWLHALLQQNAEITTPHAKYGKEINFFSHSFTRGYDWYERRFPETPDTIKGEISPSYFNDLNSPARAFEYNPKLKLIIIMRDPIDRAISHFSHEVRQRRVLEYSVDSFYRQIDCNPSIIDQSQYIKHLARWLDYFPKSQIQIFDFDDIKNQPDELAFNIFSFLGVNCEAVTTLPGKVNGSYKIKSKAVYEGVNIISTVADRVLGKNISQSIKNHWYVKSILNLNRQVLPPIKVGIQQDKRFEEKLSHLEFNSPKAAKSFIERF